MPARKTKKFTPEIDAQLYDGSLRSSSRMGGRSGMFSNRRLRSTCTT